MKISVSAVLVVAVVVTSAEGGGTTSGRDVIVCLNPGTNASTVYRGQATAARILMEAGIRLNWRSDSRTCTQGKGIQISVSVETPPNQRPGALAYAAPFEGSSIVLFYDRVLSVAGTALAPSVLGHVLAHEIVHVLQGTDTHSAIGIMKPRWDKRDYDAMQRATLPFTQADLRLLDLGFELRAPGRHPAQ